MAVVERVSADCQEKYGKALDSLLSDIKDKKDEGPDDWQKRLVDIEDGKGFEKECQGVSLNDENNAKVSKAAEEIKKTYEGPPGPARRPRFWYGGSRPRPGFVHHRRPFYGYGRRVFLP